MQLGAYRNRVLFQNPGPPVPDGDGGYSQSWVDLTPPTWKVAIAPATADDLERVAAGTVLSSASYLVTGPFHSGVTTAARMVFNGTLYSIVGTRNVDMQSVTMELGAVALVP